MATTSDQARSWLPGRGTHGLKLQWESVCGDLSPQTELPPGHTRAAAEIAQPENPRPQWAEVPAGGSDGSAPPGLARTSSPPRHVLLSRDAEPRLS